MISSSLFDGPLGPFQLLFSLLTALCRGIGPSFFRGILLTGKTMELFLERLAGGHRSFRDLGMGETAALSLSKGMRRGQDSPVDKSLKKQAREPWNERKGFMVSPIQIENFLWS
jgi:hypothetical protein